MSFVKLKPAELRALNADERAQYDLDLAAFEEQEANASASTKKLKEPALKSFRAQLVSTDVSHDESAIIMNVATAEGEMQQIWVNAGFWAILSKRIKEDDFIEITVEKRVEGVTQYEDENGAVQFHTVTGEGFRNAVKINKAMFDREANTTEQAIERDLAMITKAPEASIGAVADYLARIRSAGIASANAQ